jgi:hypothetical protein
MTDRPSSEAQRFALRLHSILREAGLPLSPTFLANAFNLCYWGDGITAHAARNWLNGISLPKADKLRALALMLQVNPQDLLFGPSHPPMAMGVEEHTGASILTLADATMLERYHALPHDHRRIVREIVAALHVLRQQDRPEDPAPPKG